MEHQDLTIGTTKIEKILTGFLVTPTSNYIRWLKQKNMKATITVHKQVEIKTLLISAGVRYWEDATVNGERDTEGKLIPLRNGDYWELEIDVDSGNIYNWPVGITADIYYKVCDEGTYSLKDKDGIVRITKDMYVPKCLSIGHNGFGDYIIMKVDENGKIKDWVFDDQMIKGFLFSDQD